MLIIFYENVSKIVLSFMVDRSKLPQTNFEFYKCNYFEMEGVVRKLDCNEV